MTEPCSRSGSPFQPFTPEPRKRVRTALTRLTLLITSYNCFETSIDYFTPVLYKKRAWTGSMSTLLICYNWRMRCPQNVNILGLAGFLSVNGIIIYSIFFRGVGGCGQKTLLSRKISALFIFLSVCLLQNTTCQLCCVFCCCFVLLMSLLFNFFLLECNCFTVLC